MKHGMLLKHEFVEYIPAHLENGVIYVSFVFATVVHKCCCGCGNEVVTPISPTDWQLIFDGKSISLYPSIGNWGFACRSHYWIECNRVKWVPTWSHKRLPGEARGKGLSKGNILTEIIGRIKRNLKK